MPSLTSRLISLEVYPEVVAFLMSQLVLRDEHLETVASVTSWLVCLDDNVETVASVTPRLVCLDGKVETVASVTSRLLLVNDHLVISLVLCLTLCDQDVVTMTHLTSRSVPIDQNVLRAARVMFQVAQFDQDVARETSVT